MAKKTYIVKTGDTIQNVSRLYYGVPTRTAEIIRSNQFLQFRQSAGNTDLSGNVNLTAGDLLTIITDPPFGTKQRSGRAPDELTLTLNGNEAPLPTGSTLEIWFDTCCNSFASKFPWSPLDKIDRALWGDPLNLPEVDIYIGNDQKFGGKFETVDPKVTSKTSNVEVSARTHTLSLVKSHFPKSAYPLEREGETLDQTVDWACSVFGLRVDNQSDKTGIIKKSSCENQTTPWDYLAPLGNSMQRVMRSSPNGYALEIVQAATFEPVAKFTEGRDGFSIPQPSYNTADLAGTYQGVSDKKPKKFETFQDPFFSEQTFRHFSINDVEPGELADSLAYQALKTYRDYFSMEFVPGGGILNPFTGDPWAVGQTISIKSPSVMIYDDFEFLIRGIKYNIGGDSKNVTLVIVPPEVYGGKPLARLPWKVRV